MWQQNGSTRKSHACSDNDKNKLSQISRKLRQTGRIPDHYGVVKTFKGFGARVLAQQHQEAVRLVRPEDAESLLGQKYEVSGLPLSCGKDAVEELLSTWTGVVAISTFRTNRYRSWIVAAPSPPLQSKFQHGQGLAYIQPARPMNRREKQPAPRFVSSEMPREKPPWEKTWAGVARGEQKSASASMASSASSAPVKPIPAAQPASAAASLVANMDIAALIRNAVAEAVAPLDRRITLLASQVHQSQTAAPHAVHWGFDETRALFPVSVAACQWARDCVLDEAPRTVDSGDGWGGSQPRAPSSTAWSPVGRCSWSPKRTMAEWIKSPSESGRRVQ